MHLGADSSVWYYAVIRGDTEQIRIGASTNLQDFTMVHADPGVPCLIGNRVTVGHRAILHGCIVEDDCLIGMGAILLNRVKVGAGSVIGAGALVPEGVEIPPGSVAMGAPAKVVRPVDERTRANRPDLETLRRERPPAQGRGVSSDGRHTRELTLPLGPVSKSSSCWSNERIA